MVEQDAHEVLPDALVEHEDGEGCAWMDGVASGVVAGGEAAAVDADAAP